MQGLLGFGQGELLAPHAQFGRSHAVAGRHAVEDGDVDRHPYVFGAVVAELAPESGIHRTRSERVIDVGAVSSCQCDLGVVSRTGHPYCPESLLEAEALGLYAGSVVQRVGEHFGRVTQVTHRLYGEAVESRGDYVEPFGTRPVQGLAQGQQGEREVVAALG